MADYYSPTVFTSDVGLTRPLYKALELQGANFHPTGNDETVLDGIVHGRPPVTGYHITFQEGWNDGMEAADYLEDVDIDELMKELGPEDFDKFKELLDCDQTDLLYHILEANPEMQEIEVQCGFACSKMRLDGYGGYGIIANRKGYLFNCTTGWEIEKDGTITPTAKFIEWETPLVPATAS